MLETAHKRILLLKTGITGKQIEELYIICNNFKIVKNPVFSKQVDINIQERRCNCAAISQEMAIESCS